MVSKPFKNRSDSSKVKANLQSRAWLLHSFLTILQIIQMSAKTTNWQNALASHKEIDADAGTDTDADPSLALEKFIRISSWTLVITGALVDLTCLWMPKAARGIIYIELMLTVCTSLAYNEEEFKAVSVSFYILASSVCFFVDIQPSLIATILATLWCTFA